MGETLAERVLAGHQASGARLIRLLEDGDPAGIDALRTVYPHAGRAHVVGLTGPPGAGKSTLVGALVAVLRKRGSRVGVIAIDPSSPFSGGAILGDRVRMQRHATDTGVFIRSMATRGKLGGLAGTTFEANVVLDVMGFDTILVETVGAGQDELEVADLAHTTAVVCLPGTGDDVQAMKAGILEVGDLFILNKADQPGADQAERYLRMMLELGEGELEWHPPILRTVAAREEGIEELADAIEDHRKFLSDGDRRAEKDARRARHFLLELVRRLATEKVLGDLEARPEARALVAAVAECSLDPYTAAERLVASVR